MKNRYKIIVIILIVLLCSIMIFGLLQPGTKLSKSEIGHAISLLCNMNYFKIEISDKLDSNNVEIFWDNIKIYNDGYFDRKAINEQRSFYGNNTFIIKYDSDTIGKFSQYKFNKWHYHKYIFSINIVDNLLKSDLEIIGTDNKVNWATSYDNE